MKAIKLVLSAALVTLLACGESSEKAATTETTATPEVAAPEAYDPDLTDTIPGGDYPAYCSDTAIAAKIKGTIVSDLAKDLELISTTDRSFRYHAFDLNNDGKDEYLVGFSNSYFCGSGGCTVYLLNNDFSIDTKFSVVKYPVYVAASTTNGWQDLIMHSGNEDRLVKRAKGKYPSNPSVEPKITGDIPNMATALLNIWDGGKYPAFSF